MGLGIRKRRMGRRAGVARGAPGTIPALIPGMKPRKRPSISEVSTTREKRLSERKKMDEMGETKPEARTRRRIAFRARQKLTSGEF